MTDEVRVATSDASRQVYHESAECLRAPDETRPVERAVLAGWDECAYCFRNYPDLGGASESDARQALRAASPGDLLGGDERC